MIRRGILAAAALIAAAATISWWWLILVGAALYVAVVLVTRRSQPLRAAADTDQTSAALVLSVATGIVVLQKGATVPEVWEVAILLAVLHGVHLGRHVLRILVSRRWRAVSDWRNLSVPVPVPRRVPPFAGSTLVALPVWVAGPLFAVFSAPGLAYVLLAVVCVALLVVFLFPVVDALRVNLALPAESIRMARLEATLRELGPEILVHFNARASSGYALGEWIGVLEQVNESHRVVILTVDRQPWHLQTIATSRIPLVHLNGAEAIEELVEQVPSIAIALYPRNTAANKNLLRVPGLYDVYLNHGESDKSEAVNPATRAFDEIWIAGDAARERYLEASVGVRPEQLRIVGRPQVAELLALSHGANASDPAGTARRRIVYAPTWEGYFAADGYSSVVAMGTALVDALLARDDIALVYLPHPALGSLNGRFREANERILARMKRAGASVVVATSPAERYAALADSELLLTDISSDLVDYLVLDRPYIVANPAAADSELHERAAFVAANPSADGGTVVGLEDVAGIAEVVLEVLQDDVLRDSRRRVARHYLGELTTPPTERFLTEVANCLTLVRETRPRKALPVASEDRP